MHEFELIERIQQELGSSAFGSGVVLGPGDDAAILRVPSGAELVSSIDTQVAGCHFPAQAPPALIGYRALMAAASDLAAMAAESGFATVALTLPAGASELAVGMARGMAAAAAVLRLPIVGGNLARGPLALTVSVQGYVPAGRAVTRVGAMPGDRLLVSGPLGGAAAAVRLDRLSSVRDDVLDDLQRAYFRPQARLDLSAALRASAKAAIDLSDGLLADLGHLTAASAVGAELESTRLPLYPGAALTDALGASDDYELCFALPPTEPLAPWLQRGCTQIGVCVAAPGITVDGEPVAALGFNHFSSGDPAS